MRTIKPYVEIARLDHWFKNLFMVLGVIVAVFAEPDLTTVAMLSKLGLAILATCLVASSNYVLNEILDGPTDRQHPIKRTRPVAAGLISIPIAYAEWLLLMGAGVALGGMVNLPFTLTLIGFWIMGTLYNVPPIRLKEIPYVDVLTESLNNPIRLLLGWFALIDDRLPSLSLLLSYWALGAFFMATKRFAEYRLIGDRTRAANYRRSFAHYNEDNLLVSMFFYVAACSLSAGVFMVRYKIELILCAPFVAGVFAYYLHLGLKENSPVQTPERLYKERGFFLYTLLTLVLFVLAMFMKIPALYSWFNLDPAKIPALWVLG